MVGHTVPHMLRFAVLGPLRVWRNGTELYVGPVQQRIVLAVLLLRANRPVSPEDLIAAVWGETPPERAVDLLRRHVAGLRRMLEPGRPVGAPSRLLVRTEAGYVLTVPSGQLDLEVFDAQVARGRAARVAGDLPAAARALHEALGLWRGRFCEGLLSPLLSGGREALEEYRLDVLEERFEIDLTLGRHAEAVAEPAGTVRGHPLRERLYARQAPAPYRPGERAEAPSGYRRDRNSGPEPFADEGDTGFGGGPGAQRLHRAGLTVDPAFAPSTPEATPPDRRPATVPCLLPGDVAGFTGRERQLAWLHRLATPDGTSTASVICLISGAPGVGKTALAVHWAHRVRPAFPDGQLYLNLRGYDPEQPMPAGEALARLLTALGLPGEDIPLDVNDRSARYRSELAGRHVLVVLDNAATAEQVRPLLPGTPTCLTVVTSRDALPGLVALDGAHRLVLGLLPTGDTHALLRRLIGPRVRAEPQAAATLA
ncbi:AfsR/SARP family transcriptional regulator, partial [Streptomyces ruber]|uniref:AfsR/SARP family transcriptional regulator n=2 Tax=Streptomyces TaxID=1883 RepID=UPI0016711C70